ncbi:uncharacterized protein L3040_001727 [Drepanopeziza brunnea f. sp. 'multigermtubi']|uniref:uncharacterized protein n=1 Tax=Drepanopeziza brunnea f. sp. 'multigermtubi' TaxID=698441 RepID=UPI00239BDC80|nr:hypothetical protein L3040_001727 [Drepanopeziza brunnea f. sp. 'multigermtubi']
MFKLQLSLIITECFVRLCVGQAAGWQNGQVNTTMCQWRSPRAAVVRDTLYIDGGYLWWTPGLSDGSYGSATSDGNPLGLVYLFNFGTPFNTSQNLSAVFDTLSKASGGGAANNIAPNYYSGAMFANDYEWFTYGGELALTDAFKAPSSNAVAAYQVYPSGPPKSFNKGYILNTLDSGITRYVTEGAAVSVPSENLGYYFGGLRSASWGPIFNLPGPRNQSVNADQLSSTMIGIDMTTQGKETWKNTTLPTTVPGRASAELVWVPVSEKGILVAIGGVLYPAYANVNQTNNASSTSISETESPKFMSSVAVYDVAKEVWYEQTTTDPPPALMQGCTVLASAQDGSSHNIYWYGGFDGLHPAGDFSDAVYILSIPSFKWMKMNSGTSSHARAGHKCVKPYPDQMLVIGGYTSLSGTTLSCVEGGIIQIYNLSSNAWIESYDPKVWSNYSIPDAWQSMLGGTATGGATQKSPSSGFADPAMTPLFATPYNSTKITNWYPYQEASPGNTTRPTLPPISGSKSSGTPGYLAPVLGVVLGLFLTTLTVLAILLYRRRKTLRRSTGRPSEAGTMDTRNWVANWLRSTPVDAKAPTMTTDESVGNPYSEKRLDLPEMGGRQVHEMMDTSVPAELHDTGTGFVAISASKRNLRHPNGLASSPSVTSQTSQASSVSHISEMDSSPSRLRVSPLSSPREGSTPHPEDQTHMVSAVSNASSEREQPGHNMRAISETSVISTDVAYATPPTTIEHLGMGSTPAPASPRIESVERVGVRPSAVSPLTPPGVEGEGGGYIGTGTTRPQGRGSPRDSKRKSIFSEGFGE